MPVIQRIFFKSSITHLTLDRKQIKNHSFTKEQNIKRNTINL